MNFIFYDTETSGLDRDFDQILQFAAVLTDGDLNELDRFETRCRVLPWIIPAPIALVVTGVTPAKLEDHNFPSHYEMMNQIRQKLQNWGPAIYVGYNSMRFDEPLLQRAFWQTLHPPFLTVLGGSSRLDLLPLVQACSHLAVGTLKFPKTSKGRIGFRLDQLAPLNGFDHTNAHDALADVEATIHIARILSNRSPEIWNQAILRSTKIATASIVEKDEPALFVEHFPSGPSIWFGQRVDNRGNKGSYSSVARLDIEWAKISKLRDSKFHQNILKSPKPLRLIAMNKAPIVYSQRDAEAKLGLTLSKFEKEQSSFLRGNLSLCDRLSDTTLTIESKMDLKTELEQKFFDGFPSSSDNLLMKKFHVSSWEDKASIAKLFENRSIRQHARRIIFANKPEILADQEYQEIRKGISERLLVKTDTDVPWRSLANARSELETLAESNLTQNIDEWLDKIEEGWSTPD